MTDRPSFAPFWRGGPRTMNALGKLQRKPSSGKAQRGSNGKMRRSTATITRCCCAGGGGTPPPFGFCNACNPSSTTPGKWTVQFAGIENCCVWAPPGSLRMSGDLNITVPDVLQTNEALGCIWRKTVLGDFGWRIGSYTEPNCLGDYSEGSQTGYSLSIGIFVETFPVFRVFMDVILGALTGQVGPPPYWRGQLNWPNPAPSCQSTLIVPCIASCGTQQSVSTIGVAREGVAVLTPA